jgi:putative transposase
VYRKPAAVSAEDLAIMALIDRHYLAWPYYGSRPDGGMAGNPRPSRQPQAVQRLMRLLGLAAVYQRPNTSNVL